MSKLTFEQFGELEAKYEAGTATADDLAALNLTAPSAPCCLQADSEAACYP